jgi:hypothetical protein
MSEDTENFHMNCGEILRLALNVESNLEFFISNYFIFPHTQKTFFLKDSIITKLSFERKIQLFEEISKKLDIKKEKSKEIINALRYVQNIRNKVAHNDALIMSNKISLIPKKLSFKKEEQVEITDELVEKVNENVLTAIHGIAEFYRYLSD